MKLLPWIRKFKRNLKCNFEGSRGKTFFDNGLASLFAGKNFDRSPWIFFENSFKINICFFDKTKTGLLLFR